MSHSTRNEQSERKDKILKESVNAKGKIKILAEQLIEFFIFIYFIIVTKTFFS